MLSVANDKQKQDETKLDPDVILLYVQEKTK